MDSTFSPRVVGTERANFYSLETFLEFPPFKGKQGEALVMAIYDYLTSTVDGTYHFWPAGEGEGNPRLHRAVSDAVKLWNAYGWAICGQTATALHELYRAAGLRTRVYGAPGHVLCEVFYDDGWHIYDVDMWTWFKTPEGHVASAYELCTNAKALIVDNTNKSDPCDLPDRKIENYAEMYEEYKTKNGEQTNIWPNWYIGAHTMDFHLRPGETLVRSQENEGRFHMTAGWKKDGEIQHKKEWHGYPRERYEPLRTFGNGRWIYEPNLSEDFTDFAEGVWEPSDLTQDAQGLVGPGTAVFRIRSPYPFCGIPAWKEDPITHSDGVWLSVRGKGAVDVEITDPEGEWTSVFSGTDTFDEKVDITGLMSSRYDCLFRVSLKDGARVDALRFEGYILTAPCSIPRLVEGENPMVLKCADTYGLSTVPWSHVVDFRTGADLAAQCVSIEGGTVGPRTDKLPTSLISPDGDKPVRVTIRFDAPAGHPFAWLYYHAQLREGPHDEDPRTAVMEWSAGGEVGRPSRPAMDGRGRPSYSAREIEEMDWHVFATEPISNSPQGWDGTVDGEVCLPEPQETVFVRLSSGTAISGLEFYGHVVEDVHEGRQVEIVHAWKEGDEAREFAAPAGQSEYVVPCGKEPKGHAITMKVPSVKAPLPR